jgi:hypothetical protein
LARSRGQALRFARFAALKTELRITPQQVINIEKELADNIQRLPGGAGQNSTRCSRTAER